MTIRLARSVWRRLEVALWAMLAGPQACLNQGGGAKYGPGPTIDCDPFSSRVASLQVTPSPAQAGSPLVVAASLSQAAGEQVYRVTAALDDTAIAPVELRDDGVAPDLVAGDGTYTGTSPTPAAGAHHVTVTANTSKEDSPLLCNLTAQADFDVTE